MFPWNEFIKEKGTEELQKTARKGQERGREGSGRHCKIQRLLVSDSKHSRLRRSRKWMKPVDIWLWELKLAGNTQASMFLCWREQSCLVYFVYCQLVVMGCKPLWHPVQGFMAYKMKTRGYSLIIPQALWYLENLPLSFFYFSNPFKILINI